MQLPDMPQKPDVTAPQAILNGRFIDNRWLLTQWQTTPGPGHTALLILPPFAEEMNCCRRLLAKLARQLASFGIDTFLPDFAGTGDSAGQFSQISLQQWRADLLQFLPELQQYSQVQLLGCRFGAALLLDWLPALQAQLKISQILLWQPQLQTDRFWQQLQRQQLLGTVAVAASEHTLDVAGYAVPLQLRTEIQTLQSHLPTSSTAILWLESSLTGEIGAAAKKIQQAHPSLQLQTIQASPYWLSQEPTDSGELISASLTFLTGAAEWTR